MQLGVAVGTLSVGFRRNGNQRVLLATRSRDPFRAELRNFVVDSLIAGSWVPLLHFNALPSAILLTVATADKINSGIRRLWLHALPGMLVALVAAAVLTGFAFQPATSMPVLLACLPILIIHTLAVSASSCIRWFWMTSRAAPMPS